MKNTGMKRYLAPLFFITMALSPTIKAELDLSQEEVDKVLHAVGILDKIVLSRAPRLDSPQNDDPSQPVSPFDLADLDIIRRCVCLIKDQLPIICSKLEKIDDDLSAHDTLICSKLIDLDQDLSAHDALICSKLGSPDDTTTCLQSIIDVPDDINDLNRNAIQLLKTILLELRGCVIP